MRVKTGRTPPHSQVREDSRAELLKLAQALRIAPLQYMAWIRGAALRKHLSEVTGISQARLATPGQQLRPSTEAKARDHARQFHRSNLTQAGFTAEEIEAAQARVENLEAAGGGTWAAFWLAMDHPVEPQLEPCIASALPLDQLVDSLEAAASGGSPNDARQAFMSFLDSWNPSEEVIQAAGGPGLTTRDWNTASTWKHVRALSERLLEAAFFDQFAHADAVWGSRFFSRLQPRPVFSLVAPKLRRPRGVQMPVRRLMQVSYALHHWARYLKWPEQPPKPKDIAEVLELRGKDVSKLFDGTTKLHFHQLEKRWERFSNFFGLEQARSFPAPLAAIAVCWQHNFVSVTPEHKLSSFIVLDSGYDKLWEWRRSTLAATGKGTDGTEPWAVWLDE